MNLLPLFPLQAVLFPGMPLPLHIFEPRYKEMMSELLLEKQMFGVIRAVDHGIADLGCAADIIEVVKTYEDGRLDLVSRGQRRFEILQLNQERNFLRGEVLYFEDENAENAAAEPQRVMELLELHSQAAKVLEAEIRVPAAGEGALSFQIAAMMPFDLDFKQTLLGMRSEQERVNSLVEYYRLILPKLNRAVLTRKKAGGNGRVPHDPSLDS